MIEAQAEQGINLERQIYEAVQGVYQTIHTSGLYKFTPTWVERLYADLDAALYELEQLSGEVRAEFREVAEGVREARNELRLSRFLFDVAEIKPLYRLVMRNRAVLRGESALCRALRAWPGPLDDAVGGGESARGHP